MKGEMKASDDQISELQVVADCDYTNKLKAFDDTKAGVKGLVDAGVQRIPRIFVRPIEENIFKSNLQLPVISLEGIRIAERRKEIVSELKTTAEKWGFFQLVNHSIPEVVLTEIIDGVVRFNELEIEEKKEFYSRDGRKSCIFNSNYDLLKAKTANWRDTMTISVTNKLNPSELPATCREASIEYSKHVTRLGKILLELLSEALDLNPIISMRCSKHTDAGFLTILLQNQINGLQILHEDHWIDVNLISGALSVNVGDLLQLITNDKFRSAEHRAVANILGPRISVACFFPGTVPAPKIYGPIVELISENNPPLYREILLSEYIMNFFSRGLEDRVNLDYYRL
ncbi:oxidoreductase [Lithospermum erythrorhizon]|uniref:Oxidoreductase n=1 Tax=Lithospermum erythrorhizon TaxID=34254 RepID=A0AAV3RQZ6_LITER